MGMKAMRYHCLLTRMAKLQNTDNNQKLTRRWSNRNSYSLLVNVQNDTATLKDILAVSYKTKHSLI